MQNAIIEKFLSYKFLPGKFFEVGLVYALELLVCAFEELVCALKISFCALSPIMETISGKIDGKRNR